MSNCKACKGPIFITAERLREIATEGNKRVAADAYGYAFAWGMAAAALVEAADALEGICRSCGVRSRAPHQAGRRKKK